MAYNIIDFQFTHASPVNSTAATSLSVSVRARAPCCRRVIDHAGIRFPPAPIARCGRSTFSVRSPAGAALR